MIRITLFSRSVLICCLVVLLVGCSTFGGKKPTAPWANHSEKKKTKYETPERVIAIWSDAVYQHPGKPATRGFGGRVYFYNNEGKVIPVDGQLVVYAYDDASAAAGNDKPTRKYGFTAEQLTHYYSDSDLGASYNVWIPWDAVGNEEKQISLFPVFIDDSGRMVRGSFANNRLPGKRNITEEERRGFYVSPRQRLQTGAPQASGGVQQAEFQTPLDTDVANGAAGEPSLKITTIRVPRTMAERMAAAPPELLQAQPYQPPPRSDGTLPSQPPANPPYYGDANTFPAQQGAYPPAMNYPNQPASHSSGSYNYPPTAPSNPLPANGTGVGTSALGTTGFIGADPQNSMSARSRAWARQDAKSAHFEPPRFRVPTMPGAPRHLERETIQQSPLTPLYAPPSTR